MDDDRSKSIKNCKIFASLDHKSDMFEALITQFEPVSIKKGETLFYQSDLPDYLYVIVSGRLAALLTAPDGKLKTVGYILPNDPVGEMGALSGDPRSATIKAVEYTRLLRLPHFTFKKLCRQYPAILFSVLRHSQHIIQLLSIGEKKKHIAIIPANKYVSLEKFEDKLKEVISHYKKVALLSETEIRSDNKNNILNVEELIAEKEKENVIILYLLQPHETPLSKARWQLF